MSYGIENNNLRNKSNDDRLLSAVDTFSSGRLDLDSHADTCVLGKQFHIFEYTGEECNVSPYSKEYDPVTVKIGHGKCAYDMPDGTTCILTIHHGLCMPNQEPSLLCPNQLRWHGVTVDDCPRHLTGVSTSTHSIIIPITTDASVDLPLELEGVISFLSIRYPTNRELKECEELELTSDSTWDPYSPDFKKNENNFGRHNPMREPGDRTINGLSRILNSVTRQTEVCAVLSDVSNTLSDDRLHDALIDTPAIKWKEIPSRGTASMETKLLSKQSARTAEQIAKKLHIGIETAQNTVRVTTQNGIRTAVHPITKRFRTKQKQLRYNRLNTQMYSDTLIADTKSTRGNKYGQVFVNPESFTKFIPMRQKGHAGHALGEFFRDIGVPTRMHVDNAKEMTGPKTKWMELIRDCNVTQTTTEPNSPWQNRAETEIKELKKEVSRTMNRTNAPKCLWDFCMEYRADIRCRVAHPRFQLKGRTPYEHVTGDTPDISEWIEHSWYDLILYKDANEHFPSKCGEQVGRWLGVSHRVGQALCYWILPKSGMPISRTTVRPVMAAERTDPEFIKRAKAFDDAIKDKLGTSDKSKQSDIPYSRTLWDIAENEVYEEGVEGDPDTMEDTVQPYEIEAQMPESDDYTVDAIDQYLTASVLLPHNDSLQRGNVRARKRDANGNVVGISNNNPLLDTRVYEVEFPDGTLKEYNANNIAESLYSQVDDEGNEFILLDEITDHRKDDTALTEEESLLPQSGANNQHRKHTTKGWQLCVTWKDGSSSWEPLKDLKESNPVQVSEYALINKISDEPAFIWWVKEVLRRRDRILSKVKSRYWKRTHKFGIELPKNVDEAMAIDRKHGNDFWKKAIEKEMKNVMTAFDFLNEGENAPIGYQQIKLHMIFDIKMDFTRKARLVAGGHMTDTPASLTYSSVVSRESVRIALLLAALNGLDVKTCDIGNAYLNAPCREKIWCFAGPEFGNRKGQKIRIVRALYGLKSSGAAWRAHLADTMINLGYKPCKADQDVWMKPNCKPDGEEYYEYILIYVDDVLAAAHNTDTVMDALKRLYRLKEEPAEPERYLGANVGKYEFQDGSKAWYQSSEEYLKNAVRIVDDKLEEAGRAPLSKKTKTVLPEKYKPELDISPECEDDQANYFQNLIGILRWAVELGRIDIAVQVSALSRYLAAPRKGHVEMALHIFSYIKGHDRSKCVFDPSIPDHGIIQDVEYDWTDFYPDAKEELPPDMPEPRGKTVITSMYVDANHAGDLITRRSQSGVLIYVNSAPITWFSKRQNTVESSTFGSEFIALRIGTELLKGLRYKLRMMGVPIHKDPSTVWVDNESVVKNTSVPESTLKKKHVAICYHLVREAAAAGIIKIYHIRSEDNKADLLTKNLGGNKLKDAAQSILY